MQPRWDSAPAPFAGRPAGLCRDLKGTEMIICQLSTLLGARRMRQAQLARLTGLHRDTIRKLYTDNWTAIRRDTLDRICTALQVTVAELLVWRDLGSRP